ncbi:helix-turn-helix domain-containing protein [Thalassospira sp. B30-1]|jgi:DNA-binding NarL/FixJ family response regulator|uniref:MarR family transcriptional regulator n=1 Tax=Thalassospira sp. B30-1 TaxID=2785911 RepID=UPI0018C93D80|nr:helix-turn-helix domain-containing protein [Thalassospira sp. B30-1]QPL36711.1 MarR family transcriptional regulator [Thalassospira sp. B30-1]
MKKEKTITIWEGCDAGISKAIEHFQDRWCSYSTASRRYPIRRLIQEVIDPAVATYMKTLPARYAGFVSGVGAGMDFSETIRLVGFDTMVRLQRQLLRHFIKTEDRQDSRDQRFVATIESLTGLVWDCACKRPKKSTTTTGVNLNAQRKHGFCELCGELTEFADFMATVADKQVNDIELQDHKKLELSHQYCAKHRPILANDSRNPAYRQAKRSLAQFNLELDRLNRQCAKRATPQAASGDPLVDRYFYHLMLSQTVQSADKGELRNQARLMVDLKLSDRKKQILILQRDGLNQSEIARRLGIERQAVSKALKSLTSLPKSLQLKE